MKNYVGLRKDKLLYLPGFQSAKRFGQDRVEYPDYYSNRRMKAKWKGLPPVIHRQQAPLTAGTIALIIISTLLVTPQFSVGGFLHRYYCFSHFVNSFWSIRSYILVWMCGKKSLYCSTFSKVCPVRFAGNIELREIARIGQQANAAFFHPSIFLLAGLICNFKTQI